MQEWVTKLLAVQEIDLKIAKIREQLEQIPAKRQEADSLYADENQAWEKAKQFQKNKEIACRQTETEIATANEKKRNFLAKTTMIKNNDEYKAAMIQIEMCDKTIDDLETKQLLLMDEIEAAKQETENRRKTVELAKKRAEAVKDDLSALENQAKARLETMQSDRDKAAAEVEPALLAQYEHKRSGRNSSQARPCFVPVIDSSCGRCRMNVTAQICQDVRKGKLVICQTCGAMLYAE